MLCPGLSLAALIVAVPSTTPSPEDPQVTVAVQARTDPRARLAELDHRRLELHAGVRAYARLLDEQAYGGGFDLGLGVRIVRGLYIMGEAGVGAHAMPVGAAGRVFIGLHHELRMSSWVRPTFTLGYSHLFDASFHADAELDCGCSNSSVPGFGFGFDVDAGAELASRSGVAAGLGLRFPVRMAPRLSFYLRGDVGYYFDDRPGRLQAGGTLGVQVVF